MAKSSRKPNAAFMKPVTPNEKLAAVVWQLPSNFQGTVERTEDFMRSLALLLKQGAVELVEAHAHVIDHDERMVDVPWNVREAREGLLAEHFPTGAVHGKDLPCVAVLAQIALRARRVLARVSGRADQRDLVIGEILRRGQP